MLDNDNNCKSQLTNCKFHPLCLIIKEIINNKKSIFQKIIKPNLFKKLGNYSFSSIILPTIFVIFVYLI
jgi:hypothetical protein